MGDSDEEEIVFLPSGASQVPPAASVVSESQVPVSGEERPPAVPDEAASEVSGDSVPPEYSAGGGDDDGSKPPWIHYTYEQMIEIKEQMTDLRRPRHMDRVVERSLRDFAAGRRRGGGRDSQTGRRGGRQNQTQQAPRQVGQQNASAAPNPKQAVRGGTDSRDRRRELESSNEPEWASADIAPPGAAAATTHDEPDRHVFGEGEKELVPFNFGSAPAASPAPKTPEPAEKTGQGFGVSVDALFSQVTTPTDSATSAASGSRFSKLFSAPAQPVQGSGPAFAPVSGAQLFAGASAPSADGGSRPVSTGQQVNFSAFMNSVQQTGPAMPPMPTGALSANNLPGGSAFPPMPDGAVRAQDIQQPAAVPRRGFGRGEAVTRQHMQTVRSQAPATPDHVPLAQLFSGLGQQANMPPLPTGARVFSGGTLSPAAMPPMPAGAVTLNELESKR